MATNGSENGVSTHNAIKPAKKQWIINAFVMAAPSHISSGYWGHPGSKTADYAKLKFWTDLAQLLDKANCK